MFLISIILFLSFSFKFGKDNNCFSYSKMMFLKAYTEELIFHEHNFLLLFEGLNHISCWQSLLDFKSFFLYSEDFFVYMS